MIKREKYALLGLLVLVLLFITIALIMFNNHMDKKFIKSIMHDHLMAIFLENASIKSVNSNLDTGRFEIVYKIPQNPNAYFAKVEKYLDDSIGDKFEVISTREHGRVYLSKVKDYPAARHWNRLTIKYNSSRDLYYLENRRIYHVL